MKPILSRAFCLALWSSFAFGVIGGHDLALPTCQSQPVVQAPARPVYLARGLSDVGTIQLGAALAAAEPDATFLLDSECLSPYAAAYLAALQPGRVVPVGDYSEGLGDVEKRLKVKIDPAIAWNGGPPLGLWRQWFPKASQVVICPAEPRAQLLQSACLAASLKAPLFVLEGRRGEKSVLIELVQKWQPGQVHLVGAASKLANDLAAWPCTKLVNEEAVSRRYLEALAKTGPIHTAVVANPFDATVGGGKTSQLAPWVAWQKHAALLLTGEAGNNAATIVEKACHRPALRTVDTLILVADLKAIPTEQRPNPIPADKDELIEMEPLTPSGRAPFSFAIGRLFHDDPAVIPLLLARQRLLASTNRQPRALVASNPGSGLPLLETFSQNTVRELRNAGVSTTALIGKDLEQDKLRKALPDNEVFLWEGHHNTLIKDWAVQDWEEPMQPSLVFLQSCLALKDYKAHPLLSRGAVGVIGSSTRTYSASGGACSLAFFNALLYEGQTVGASLRQAKNFLMVYTMLKDKRLGTDAKRSGANLRAAWAFTLWGDPTATLPRPEKPADALPTVSHDVTGNTITVQVPTQRHGKVQSGKFQVEMPANGRLAGLLRKEKLEDGQPLVPFVFAEVRLPRAKTGHVPTLSSRLPSSHWVFNWDERRGVGYLLIEPRSKEDSEIRFHVKWTAGQQAEEAIAVGAGD